MKVIKGARGEEDKMRIVRLLRKVQETQHFSLSLLSLLLVLLPTLGGKHKLLPAQRWSRRRRVARVRWTRCGLCFGDWRRREMQSRPEAADTSESGLYTAHHEADNDTAGRSLCVEG